MALSDYQKNILTSLREGTDELEQLYRTLNALEPKHYKQPSLREFLFALDASCLMYGSEWQRVFVNNTVELSGLIDKGTLNPNAYAEIGQYFDTYGRGLYGVACVVQLFESSKHRPNNAKSFTRRCIREFYNGIQPVTNFGMMLLDRFLFAKEIDVKDVDLLFHVNEETKGLENAEQFPRRFAHHVANAVIHFDPYQTEVSVIKKLTESDELSAAELCLIRELDQRDVKLNRQLLAYTDQSANQLAGLST